jgi:hypothetical protein
MQPEEGTLPVRLFWKRGAGPDDRICGLKRHELAALATYNGERSRGLVHTEEYQQRMARLQQTYDDASRMQDNDATRG